MFCFGKKRVFFIRYIESTIGENVSSIWCPDKSNHLRASFVLIDILSKFGLSILRHFLYIPYVFKAPPYSQICFTSNHHIAWPVTMRCHSRLRSSESVKMQKNKAYQRHLCVPDTPCTKTSKCIISHCFPKCDIFFAKICIFLFYFVI